MALEQTVALIGIPTDFGIRSILFFILAAAATIFLVSLYYRILRPWFSVAFDKSPVEPEIFLPEQKVDESVYHPDASKDANNFYIRPNYLTFDPILDSHSPFLSGVRKNLFAALDSHLDVDADVESNFIVLLAGAGMGKSSFSRNYYKRHQGKLHKRFTLVHLALNKPGVEERILQVKRKDKTAIFLDGFNEDVDATIAPIERLYHLMSLTRDFLRVVITSRSRFFPKNEEIHGKPGLFKITSNSNHDADEYTFYKFYIAPFNKKQIETFLNRRFQTGQIRKREKARALINRMPHIALNPIFLTYIPELSKSDSQFEDSYELYGEIIKSWVLRETEHFKRFSPGMILQLAQQLAANIYANRQWRLEESIPPEEFAAILKEWNASPKDWMISERSLFKKGRNGNYKFVHRSFMEYLFVQQFIKGDKACCGLKWSGQMQAFLWELIRKMIANRENIPFDLTGADLSDYQTQLRFTPLQKLVLQELQLDTPENTVKKFDFYDYFDGQGISNVFEMKDLAGYDVIIDHATRLMWQPSGSSTGISFEDALAFIAKLNENQFAGFSDWRLPTIDEAMSLVEPQVIHGLHIEPIFSPHQASIWTADSKGDSAAWAVKYDSGLCVRDSVDQSHFVRAIRTAY